MTSQSPHTLRTAGPASCADLNSICFVVGSVSSTWTETHGSTRSPAGSCPMSSAATCIGIESVFPYSSESPCLATPVMIDATTSTAKTADRRNKAAEMA